MVGVWCGIGFHNLVEKEFYSIFLGLNVSQLHHSLQERLGPILYSTMTLAR